MKLNSALLLTALAAVIWGGTAPVMKLTLVQIPVFSLAALRMGFASLILGLLIIKQLKIKKSDYPTFFLAALTGVTLNISLFFLGLKLTEAILVGFLVASVPVLTLLTAHFFLKEKFTPKLAVASVLALIGIAILAGKSTSLSNSKELIGNLLLIASTISWVAYEIISKKLLKSYSGSVVAFYTMAIGTLTFLPFAIFEFFKNPNWYAGVTTQGTLGLLYGIFFSSLVAYWAWNKGLQMLPAGKAAFFFYLDPISGAILSIILLGEKITSQLLLGGLFIFIAVLVAEQQRKSHPLHNNIS